jgi:aminopeptidase N
MLLLPFGSVHAEPDYAPVPGDFDILSHELQITPNFGDRTISARQRMEIKIGRHDLQNISFSANALSVDFATIDGKAVTASRSPYFISFGLPGRKKAGMVVHLDIRYTGTPKRGLVWGNDYVYSSYWTCDWMFCLQDWPADKARFKIGLTLPDNYVSLGIGLPDLKSRAGVTRGHDWKSQTAYSAYLFGFAAGKFQLNGYPIGDRKISFLSPAAGFTQHRELAHLISEMVAFLEAKSGMILPGQEHTQLVVPGNEAQEAATFAIVGQSHIDAALSDENKEWATIHELSHRWWGNMVTCEDWSELWLQEGMAVYMTAAWKEHRIGRAAYEAELAIARQRYQRTVDKRLDKPLAYSGVYASLADRRAIQYSKGALFLHELRTAVGDDAFWHGIKLYTRKHAGGVVSSDDLQHAMESASGRKLTLLFNQWVYEFRPVASPE